MFGLVLTVVSGCGGGDNLPREAVSGSVTLDGVALPAGTITLMPTDPAGAGTAVAAEIRKGTFEVPREKGPAPGSYRVLISAPVAAEAPRPPADSKTFDATSGTGAEDMPSEPVMRESIPPRYNSETTLKADITAGIENRLEYKLVSR